MAWLTANWLWVLIGIVFIAMHAFGHGGHGGHGGGKRRPRTEEEAGDDSQAGGGGPRARGHQH